MRMAAASKKQACILLLLLLLTLLSSSIQAAEIAVYWGQNTNDTTLSATCESGNYGIVILAYLNVFGGGNPLKLNLTGHCPGDDCSGLESEIKQCQDLRVKVYLSLGGPYGNYHISNSEEAKEVANNLYQSFLSGNPGPLGDNVTLDGIDFHIQSGPNSNWDTLANELDTLRQPNRTFSLSAAPRCVYPDFYLRKAINTHVFDDIFVQFYNQTLCQYSNISEDSFYDAWDEWTSKLPSNNTVFLGLPAAATAFPNGGGYIPTDTLTHHVLPYVDRAPNYGGVMLWDGGYDAQTLYGAAIKNSLTIDLLLESY